MESQGCYMCGSGFIATERYWSVWEVASASNQNAFGYSPEVNTRILQEVLPLTGCITLGLSLSLFGSPSLLGDRARCSLNSLPNPRFYDSALEIEAQSIRIYLLTPLHKGKIRVSTMTQLINIKKKPALFGDYKMRMRNDLIQPSNLVIFLSFFFFFF